VVARVIDPASHRTHGVLGIRNHSEENKKQKKEYQNSNRRGVSGKGGGRGGIEERKKKTATREDCAAGDVPVREAKRSSN